MVTAMTLDTDSAMFETRSENEENFAKDYYNLVDTDIPLWAVKEELLHLMERHNIKHFRVPGTKCRDKNEHLFFFEIQLINDTKVKKYRYIGHS